MHCFFGSWRVLVEADLAKSNRIIKHWIENTVESEF